jgi:hypothetical protein
MPVHGEGYSKGKPDKVRSHEVARGEHHRLGDVAGRWVLPREWSQRNPVSRSGVQEGSRTNRHGASSSEPALERGGG